MEAKQVAALAGVLRYLVQRQLEAKGPGGGALPPTGPRPWALFGRQAIMFQRIRIQRRRRR